MQPDACPGPVTPAGPLAGTHPLGAAAPSAESPASAVRIERFRVHSARLACDVVFAPGVPRDTAPALMRRVARAFPNLPHHACVNGRGATFVAVMDDTPLPHLLEHLVIDLQVQAHAQREGAAFTFVGTSEWTDRVAGRARIDVTFADDLVALQAFRDATAYLNSLLAS